MTYGFRPENWPAFQAELLEIAQGMVEIAVTLRSGRVESWSQSQTQ